METLAGILKSVAEWFKNLPGPIKEGVVFFGLLVVAAGLVLPVFLGLQAAALALDTSIGGMIAAALPIIGIAAGIVIAIIAVIAIVKHLWQTNEGFRELVTNVWNTIQSTINSVVQAIVSFVQEIWGTLVSWWTENQELIQSTAEKVWQGIQDVINAVMTVLGPLIQVTFDGIKTTIEIVWNTIKTIIEIALNVILGIIKAVMQAINGDWSGAWETIKGIGESVWNSIRDLINSVITSISQFISNTLNTIQNTFSTIWNAISSTVSSVINGISSTISSVLNGISGTVSSVWEGIRSTISNAINGARDAVGSAIEAIKGLFNFQISWPHIPLPHFRVSGSPNPLDWLKGGLPSIGIDWYAKGGILTKPTAFGMNGNKLMVGGEAGNEAVLPLNERNLSAIGRGIAETMEGMGITINFHVDEIHVREESDIDKIADRVAAKMAYELRRKRELLGGAT